MNDLLTRRCLSQTGLNNQTIKQRLFYLHTCLFLSDVSRATKEKTFFFSVFNWGIVFVNNICSDGTFGDPRSRSFLIGSLIMRTISSVAIAAAVASALVRRAVVVAALILVLRSIVVVLAVPVVAVVAPVLVAASTAAAASAEILILAARRLPGLHSRRRPGLGVENLRELLVVHCEPMAELPFALLQEYCVLVRQTIYLPIRVDHDGGKALRLPIVANIGNQQRINV